MPVRSPLVHRVLHFLRNPALGLTANTLLFLSALAELLEELGVRESPFGVHHGILVFGFHRMLITAAELIEHAANAADEVAD